MDRMRLHDDYDYNKSNSNPGGGFSATTISIAVFLCVGVVFGVVLMANSQPPKKTGIPSVVQEETASAEELLKEEKNTLTSDDLEFWSFFAEEESKEAQREQELAEESKKKAAEEKAAKKKGSEENSTEETAKEHEKETLVKKADGKEEWIPLNPYLDKNKYDYAGLVYQEPIMKYFENSKQISNMGISLYDDLGTVDYNRLKKSGINFVMIKVGARGYGSGNLTVDESFVENMKGAAEAGLDIGVYFFSQAISEEEALEEANLVLEQLKEYKVVYPVAFNMEEISADTARIDKLSREEKSKVTGAFLKTISAAGHKTAIYGNKEWLLQKINLSLLSEYDIWLSEEADIPDYPYKFAMWKYKSNAKIDGVEKDAELSISFIDYTKK